MIIKGLIVQVYDIEIFPNCFSLTIKNTETKEITHLDEIILLLLMLDSDILHAKHTNHCEQPFSHSYRYLVFLRFHDGALI